MALSTIVERYSSYTVGNTDVYILKTSTDPLRPSMGRARGVLQVNAALKPPHRTLAPKSPRSLSSCQPYHSHRDDKTLGHISAGAMIGTQKCDQEAQSSTALLTASTDWQRTANSNDEEGKSGCRQYRDASGEVLGNEKPRGESFAGRSTTAPKPNTWTDSSIASD